MSTAAPTKTKQDIVLERYEELEKAHPEMKRDEILRQISEEQDRSFVSVQSNYYRGRDARKKSGGKQKATSAKSQTRGRGTRASSKGKAGGSSGRKRSGRTQAAATSSTTSASSAQTTASGKGASSGRGRSRRAPSRRPAAARGRAQQSNPAAEVERAAAIISDFATNYTRMQDELTELREKVSQMEAVLT